MGKPYVDLEKELLAEKIVSAETLGQNLAEYTRE
jgi:hypothetical protein